MDLDLPVNTRHSLARERRPVGFELRAKIENRHFCWVLLNISAGGFLVHASSPPAVDTRFDFTIVTEEIDIHGVAKVVRHEPATGRPTGFAARFCAVHGDGRRQIAEILRG